MKNNKKDTFDSLNNKINAYKDGLGILDGLLSLYKSCFDFDKQDSVINNLIIDYGLKIIEKYKGEGLKVFHNILIKDISNNDYTINNIEYGKFMHDLEAIESFVFDSFNFFINTMDLEISTFLEKNEFEFSDLNFYMNITCIDSLKKLILDLIKKTLKKSKKFVVDEIRLKVEEFNRSLWKMKKEISVLMSDKVNMEWEFFIEQVLYLRDGYLERIEELQNTIRSLAEERFFKSNVKYINIIIQYEIQKLTDKYKGDLNKCFILKLVNERDNYRENCFVKTKTISDKDTYVRREEILSIELEYFSLGLRLVVNNFNVLEGQIKANLDSVFYNELYSPMYVVESQEDFSTMIEAFEAKASYIVYNMAINMFKFFTIEYPKSISLMMKKRIESIEKLYFFKPISYMGIVKIHNPEIVVGLQKELYAIYGTYDFKKNMDKGLDKMLSGSKILNSEVEELIDGFINKLQIESSNAELNEKKKSFQENINNLKSELWRNLDSKFIYDFNYLNQSIIGDIESIKRAMKLYEN